MNLTSLGITKDLTSEFFQIRMDSVGGNPFEETSVQTVTINETPQWSQVVDQIKMSITDTRFKMGELSRAQKKYLSIDLDDYDAIRRDVDNKTIEIKTCIREMENNVIRFSRFKEIDSPEIIKNVQISLAEEVNKLTEEFKQNNKQYLIKLKQRTQKFDDCFSMGEDHNDYSFGFDEKQLTMLSESEDLVNQRVEEIKKITKLFKTLLKSQEN
ncbi:Syntaxin-16 [Entamoeba marina]